MSEIVQFPARGTSPENRFDDEIHDDGYRPHAEAFRDLENRLMDCVSMSKIAFDQICEHKTEDRELVFAVAHTWELLEKLKKDYYASYADERLGGLHTSST
jgi:hypothetical protein